MKLHDNGVKSIYPLFSWSLEHFESFLLKILQPPSGRLQGHNPKEILRMRYLSTTDIEAAVSVVFSIYVFLFLVTLNFLVYLWIRFGNNETQPEIDEGHRRIQLK